MAVAGGRALLVDRGPLVDLARDGGAAAVEAVVAAEPRTAATGAWTLVRVAAVDGRRTRARAFLRLPEAGRQPELGERLAFRAVARRLGRRDFEAHLRRLGAGTELLPLGEPHTVAGPGRALAATNAARARVRAAAARHLGPDDAALLTGLVTGDTRGMTPERQERYEAAGLTHLVAVSGSNVALVLAGVLGLAGAVGLGARARRLAALAALAWFVVLVRWEPSVLRAAAMAALVLASGLRGRGSDARHALGVAALLLLLADPGLAGQLGFALSLGATAGVLVVGPVVAERVPGPAPLRRLLGASLGAQLGVAPVLLGLPDGLPLAGLPANLLAVPAAAAASAAGVAAALAAQLSVPLGGLLALAAWPALRLVAAVAEVFAAGPRLTAAGATLPVLALLGAGLLARRRAPLLAVVTVVLAVALAGLPALLPPAAADRLTVTALDVGQGDAVLVEVPAPDGTTARLLVDGGPESGALPALRARRIRRLDGVVLTHPHADHSDGLPGVLAELDVGALLVGPRPPPGDATPTARQAYATAEQRGVPVLPVAAGSRFPLGGAVVEVLGPPAPAPVSGR
jgi:competence protein ComEC